MKKENYFHFYADRSVSAIRDLFLNFLILLTGSSHSKPIFIPAPPGTMGKMGPMPMQGAQPFILPGTGLWITKPLTTRGYNAGGGGSTDN